MSKSKPGLFGTLMAVGALGATAGMLALRWSQRHRAQRQHMHRDLSRWEDEGGALSESANGAFGAAAGKPMDEAAMHGRGAPGASEDANGAWPFPQSDADSATRH
ncbi:hypothetical protein [Paraburkholderia sp. J67]|uniref:hypothetical protein n=1 Tax=Paraburkholderia sp. J67 TaxID=2805435 RepID=UPI002ABE81A8|nr:hypothetical protein [Paraburkholderia sp. J67]